jgi:NitT/TauT family transport system substrate-binding protein
MHINFRLHSVRGPAGQEPGGAGRPRAVATGRALACMAVGVAALAAAACGSANAAGASQTSDPGTVRLGYLTNLTHAPALIGVSKGYFQSSMPRGTTLQTDTFSAGPAESEALLGGSLDAAFVGPNPAISAFLSTKGKGVRIVAGAAAGGAGLVVSPAIASGNFPADLKGQTLASPQLGNTQDVALRTWLSNNGLSSSISGGGGDVTIDSSSGNAVDLQRFVAHQIAGGWEPEPYESQYVIKGHGKLVVDEASLWPASQFPTTELVVSTALLINHPDIVTDLIKGLIQSVDWMNKNPSAARGAATSELALITGAKPLSSAVVKLAWTHLTFTVDPLAADLQADANHALKAGVIKSASLKGIIDVGPLNNLRSAAGKPSIDGAGLAL